MTALRVVRDCDCPAWVVECAHEDGRSIVLTDLSKLPNCPLDCKTGVWTLGEMAGPWDVCSYPSCEQLSCPAVSDVEIFDNEADALAAFNAASAALVGRVAS